MQRSGAGVLNQKGRPWIDPVYPPVDDKFESSDFP